jgi:DNA-binding transcriptional LysR family regulator
VLTDEGTAFLEDCQRILGELQSKPRRRCRSAARAPAAQLLVSAPAGFGRQHVAPLLPSFLAEHREVTVKLQPE